MQKVSGVNGLTCKIRI